MLFPKLRELKATAAFLGEGSESRAGIAGVMALDSRRWVTSARFYCFGSEATLN